MSSELVSGPFFFLFFKQKTAYELRISDWSSDVCSSELADGGAQRAVARVPHPKAGVAGIEVVFFLVARPVGNVRLAIDAEPAAVGVDHRQRIVVRVVGALEEADRQHDVQLRRQRRHARADRKNVGWGTRVSVSGD